MQDLLGCWTSCPVLALLFFTCTNTGLYFITHKHNKKKLFIKVLMRWCNSLSTINISYFTGKTSNVFVQGSGLAFFFIFIFYQKQSIFLPVWTCFLLIHMILKVFIHKSRFIFFTFLSKRPEKCKPSWVEHRNYQGTLNSHVRKNGPFWQLKVKILLILKIKAILLNTTIWSVCMCKVILENFTFITLNGDGTSTVTERLNMAYFELY